MDPRKRLRRIIKEVGQIIRDIEWWNNNRTEEQPLDCEADRIVLQKARKLLQAVENGNENQMAKLNEELESYCRESSYGKELTTEDST